jgi:hypothetical protein
MPEVDINDYLEKDSIRVPGQEYAIISVISPKSRQKADHLAVKIKGVFPNMDEAKKHAAKLQKIDDTFDLFVVEMYSWLLLPPETEKIGEKHYSDEKLEELIIEHDKEMEEAKANFEKHRREQKKAGKLQEHPELEDKSDSTSVVESESQGEPSSEAPKLENID